MSETTRTKYQSTLVLFIVFVLAFDGAFLVQKLSGAYESEFGAHPDEAAHYVTGLFARDALCAGWKYALGGFHGSPMGEGRQFAQQFYDHYPKVALGVWPPVFYLAQSAWTLPFGESRTSILLFMAFLTACVAALIFHAVAGEYGVCAAASATLLWLGTPLVGAHASMVMAEMLTTLTMFAAALAWGRFLDEARWRHAVVFSILASLAILTKGTGIALVLMCGFSIVASAKWQLLRSARVWVAALIVALIAGPWTWYFRDYGTRVGGWADNRGVFSAEFTRKALPFYAAEMAVACGLAVATFAGIGALVRFRGERAGRWAALSGLVLAVLVFQSLVPVGLERRHILPVTPALVLLAVAGVHGVARLPAFRTRDARQPRRELQWLCLLLLLTLPLSLLRWEKKGCGGFARIAAEILEKAPAKARILISSDASGEGMFIAEVAMRDKRPNLTIERAGKTLVEEKGRTWDGRNQRNRFKDDEELLRYLTSGRFAYIVLDDAVPDRKRAPYHDQIKRVIDDHSDSFWPIEESAILRDNETTHRPARLYRVSYQRREVLQP